MKVTEQYHKLLRKILTEGVRKPSGRSNMPDTLYLFGEYMKINLQDGFPIITTKNVSFKNIVVELLWFLKGDSNIKYLIDNGCNIWNQDAYNYYSKLIQKEGYEELGEDAFDEFVQHVKENYFSTECNYKWGDTGEQYPRLWRSWNGDVDQIINIVDGLKNNPFSRRHKIQSFNSTTIDNCALPPCHTDATFDVGPDNELSCSFHMRSNDVMLGLPYNIASYALLTHILAKICNYEVGNLVIFLDNVHIYMNHIDAAKEQLERDPNKYDLPDLLMLDEFHYLTDENISGNVSVDEIIEKIRLDFFILNHYKHYPKLLNPTPLNTGMN